MNSAPIALFVFNRPEHTRRTVEALAGNELASESELYVFADGPKPNCSEKQLRQIEAVRQSISAISGFRKVQLHVSETNQGLSTSITRGINKVFEKHDRLVVVEDDIFTHPQFLRFCNDALNYYEHTDSAFAVSGFSFPLKGRLPPTYFLRTGAVWGWACWKRSWSHFTMDSGKLLSEIESKGRIREFNFDNNYDFFGMLKKHHEGKISSWDVCWYASLFVANGLTYYPRKSLTMNIGMDGSGTHYSGPSTETGLTAAINLEDAEIRSILNHHPVANADPEATRALTRYLIRFEKGGFRNRIKYLIKKYFKIHL